MRRVELSGGPGCADSNSLNAHIARGHFLNAQANAHTAAKWHADQFSDAVMKEHPVTT